MNSGVEWWTDNELYICTPNLPLNYILTFACDLTRLVDKTPKGQHEVLCQASRKLGNVDINVGWGGGGCFVPWASHEENLLSWKLRWCGTSLGFLAKLLSWHAVYSGTSLGYRLNFSFIVLVLKPVFVAYVVIVAWLTISQVTVLPHVSGNT